MLGELASIHEAREGEEERRASSARCEAWSFTRRNGLTCVLETHGGGGRTYEEGL